jgi:hypothetical protein
MNTGQKRRSIVGLTVLLILFACASLHGVTGTPTVTVFYTAGSIGGSLVICGDYSSGWTCSGGGPYAATGSAITSVLDTLNQWHTFYLDTDNQIEEVRVYGQNEDGQYLTANDSPNSTAGLPAAAAGSALTVLLDPTSGNSFIHLFYEGTNGDVYHVYCNCASTSADPPDWVGDSPTTLAPGAPVAKSGSPLTSVIDLSPGHDFIHLYYLGTNQNVYELYWVGGSAWHYDDTTSLAGAPVPASNSKLTSFIDNSNNDAYVHVYYLGTNQNVYEMYYTGSWHSDDTSSLAGAPAAASGSALTSLINNSGVGDTGIHVMYLGTNGNVYDLHYVSTWSYFDPTTVSGAPSAASGSALTSFLDSGAVYLFFTNSPNSDLYELHWPAQAEATYSSVAAEAPDTGLAGLVFP